MSHEIRWDKKGDFLKVRLIGSWSVAEVAELCTRCSELLDYSASREVIIDVSGIETFPDHEVRNRLTEGIKEARIGRLAIVGTRPEVKIIGSVLIELFCKFADAEFFPSEQGARGWLNQASEKGRFDGSLA